MKVLAKRALITLLILILCLGVVALALGFPSKKHTSELFGKIKTSEIIELKWNDLSKTQKYQLLTVEDPDFYNHSGFDFSTPGAGLTTITQSLVKQFYFKKFTPGLAKIKQTLIAWLVVSPQVSKDDQLLVFINTVYLGETDSQAVYGLAQASRSYFGKEFSDLSEEQYLALVAMIIAPNKLSVLNHPEDNKRRVQRIQKLLKKEYTPRNVKDVWYDKEL